jgi:hypothetical protein
VPGRAWPCACAPNPWLPALPADEDEQFKDEKAVIIREISSMNQPAQEQPAQEQPGQEQPGQEQPGQEQPTA